MYFLGLGVTGLILGACIRQMNCDTREQGMIQSIHSMNSSGFHSTKPSPGTNYSTTNSHNSIYAVDQGEITKFEPWRILSTKTEQYYI